MTFAKRLKLLLKAHRTTQRELAYSLCINEAVVSAWCIGRRLPNVKNLYRIAVFFDLTMQELYFGNATLDELLTKEE